MTENKQFTFDRDTVAPNIKTPIVFKEGERLSIGEVLGKLNELMDENKQLKRQIFQLKLLVQNWEALDDEKDEQLDRQNKALIQLKEEKENWKLNACDSSSFNSVLLHELDLAQEQGYKISDPFKKLMREKND